MRPSKPITDYFKPATHHGIDGKDGDQDGLSKTENDPNALETRRLEALAKLEKKKALKLEHDNICPSWMSAVIGEELSKPYFKKIKDFLLKEASNGHKVYPPEHQIYSWTKFCEFSSVRAVIIGQDPYHNQGQAHGLAFSVPRNFQPLPPSLLNIYKEFANDIPGFTHPKHGDLTGWAQQGVLLLNATLTVRAHEPGSHSSCGWEHLTDAIIAALSTRSPRRLVFMLWGKHAQLKGSGIDTARHLMLKAPHPSPLSASRGFFGCHHFSQCNAFLSENGDEPIDWSRL